MCNIQYNKSYNSLYSLVEINLTAVDIVMRVLTIKKKLQLKKKITIKGINLKKFAVIEAKHEPKQSKLYI